MHKLGISQEDINAKSTMAVMQEMKKQKQIEKIIENQNTNTEYSGGLQNSSKRITFNNTQSSNLLGFELSQTSKIGGIKPK